METRPEYLNASDIAVLQDMLVATERMRRVGGSSVADGCIWGVAIEAGHAVPYSAWGRGLPKNVQKALKRSAKRLFGAPMSQNLYITNDKFFRRREYLNRWRERLLFKSRKHSSPKVDMQLWIQDAIEELKQP